MVLREPVGPVALIVPWNFPLLIACWKVAPALACGNPIILKPASLTPLTALLLGDLLVEAGVVPEAVSVLPGPGGVVGDALVGDRRVAKIGFTGETTTGASILKASADHIARVSLELGGKSASVVFADADLEALHRRHADVGVRQRRPGLLRPQPHPGGAAGLRRVRRRLRRPRPSQWRSAPRSTRPPRSGP